MPILNSARELDPARLEPCPFCGWGARVQENGRDGSRFWECACDACDFTGPAFETRDEALAHWNRRFKSGPERAPASPLDTRLLARIRELSTPAKDDHDRAVVMLLDAYEDQERSHQEFRLQNDREWKAKVDAAKARSGPERAAEEMLAALTTVLTALEASRGCGTFPDFAAWESSARAAIAAAQEPKP